MTKAILDGDRLNSVNLRRVGNATMAVTDALQNYSKEDQVVAAATFFILLCKTYGVHAPSAFGIAERVIKASNADRPEILAAEQYMKGELL